jgi:hypothetical protein
MSPRLKVYIDALILCPSTPSLLPYTFLLLVNLFILLFASFTFYVTLGAGLDAKYFAK